MIATTQQKLTAAETSRGIALERLIRVAQALQRTRFGIKFADLIDEVSEATGHDWHSRTIRRDLELLEYMGLASVTQVVAGNRWVLSKVICRWIGSGGFFEQPATVAGLTTDEAIRHQHASYFREKSLVS